MNARRLRGEGLGVRGPGAGEGPGKPPACLGPTAGGWCGVLRVSDFAPLAGLREPVAGCHRGSRAAAAFTMVEIALALAIVAFAMVAILGVLPTGLTVQKENREETLITQDGLFLLQAIRSGARGLDELTNYVDSITISNLTLGTRETFRRGTGPRDLSSGARIIGLLSTPKYQVAYLPNSDPTDPQRIPIATNTNVVVARMRALSGVAAEKTPSVADDDLSFGYLVTSEISPLKPSFLPEQVDFSTAPPVPEERLARFTRWMQTLTYQSNYHQVRLTIRYPLIPGPNANADIIGANAKSFRTLASGRLVTTNDGPLTLHFLEPQTFVQVTNVIPPAF